MTIPPRSFWIFLSILAGAAVTGQSLAQAIPTLGAVQVQRFHITGNTAIPSEELQQIVAPYEGKAMTLLEIYDVADLLTRHYRTSGYTLASAFVPEQQVASGVITIEIIEGKLGAVRTEGTRRTPDSDLSGRRDHTARLVCREDAT